MDPLARAALVGTGRHPDVRTPGLEALSEGLEGRSPERRLLLAAGARAVARAAGRTASDVGRGPEPAAPETGPACSPGAARLLRRLLMGRHAELLPEALSRLAAAGMLVPHALLPLALASDPQLRDAVDRVLGVRGVWLAGQSPSWGWVMAPTDAEPTPDEATLEEELGHGAQRIRLAAVRQLACMPDSRLARQMARRASSLLTSRMEVRLPAELDAAWRRDLGAGRPQEGMGQKAGWLLRSVALVPPSHWEDRFGRHPWRLVEDIAPDEVVLAEALTRATLLHDTRSWAGPLWDWWQSRVRERRGQSGVVDDLCAALLDRMPQEEAEGRVASLLEGAGDAALEAMLEALRTPWSADFSHQYLVALHQHVAALGAEATGSSLPWLRSVTIAARALSPSVLDEAAAPLPLARSRSWRIRQWRARLDAFAETTRVRQHLVEEIPL